jgi:hypothetical protein
MIPTRLAAETGASGRGGGDERADGDGDSDAELKRVAPDSVALPAATMLYLTSGRADWLSGRFVPPRSSANSVSNRLIPALSHF